MATVSDVTEVDVDEYWHDVHCALTTICQLTPEEAHQEIAKTRHSMACLSDFGRLLAYHDGVPRVAEDIWAAQAEHDEHIVEQTRAKLENWYSSRIQDRIPNMNAPGLPSDP